MHPRDALLQHGGVPRHFEVDHRVGRLQVQAGAARVGAQEDPARRRRRGSAPAACAAPAPARCRAAPRGPGRASATTSAARCSIISHWLKTTTLLRLAVVEQLAEQLVQLVELRRDVRLPVEQERAVAEHAQVGDAGEDAPAIHLAEVLLLQQPGQRRLVARRRGRAARRPSRRRSCCRCARAVASAPRAACAAARSARAARGSSRGCGSRAACRRRRGRGGR